MSACPGTGWDTGGVLGRPGRSAWERTSSAGQDAGRRFTALTDGLQQG